MNEQEWLACEDPDTAFKLTDSQTSSRKWRLFAVACCYRVRSQFGDFGWDLVELAEELIEGHVSAYEVARQLEFTAITDVWLDGTHAGFDAARCEGWNQLSDSEGRPAAPPPTITDHYSGWDAERTAKSCASLVIDWSLAIDGGGTEEPAYIAERMAQLALLRDIFGNPFRPVSLDSAWLTSDVLALARGIYDERAFDRMPILADALQDAGCDNDAILTHCRGSEPHVRGCWVVDLLLGKA